jgi:adrenodoxin-NADP+ reductase
VSFQALPNSSFLIDSCDSTRFGVAPDHPEVKNVITTFSKTAENANFRYFGNISLGEDVSLKQLQENYDAVLLTYGADQDAILNIPNENLKNVLSAREFVGWYNGLPGCENLNPDLSGETVMLLGQGNVAVDVARILLSQIDQLSKTDITQYALDFLIESKVKRVYLVGRRGPLQVAFTIKELREMLKLPGVSTVWRPEDFQGVQEVTGNLARPRKRLTELMLTSLKESKIGKSGEKEFLPVFNRSPIQVNGEAQVKSLDFRVNRVIDNRAISTEQSETIPANLVCRSIGYKSISVDQAINFDDKKGFVKNRDGRILQKDSDEIERGLYVSGWLGTGPTGVILTTMNASFGVADTICKDFQNNQISSDPGKNGLDFSKHRVVTWKDWQKIDQFEVKEGEKVGKPREKIVKVEKMLEVAGV